MKVKVVLDLEELDLIIVALDDKHVACPDSIDFLPKVRAVNSLYNRLIELSEEHDTSCLETFAKGLAREALQRAANHDLSLQDVHQAYNRLRGRQLGSAVFISDLATELQIGLPKRHEWIHREVIKSGHGSLDEGHCLTVKSASFPGTAARKAWKFINICHSKVFRKPIRMS